MTDGWLMDAVEEVGWEGVSESFAQYAERETRRQMQEEADAIDDMLWEAVMTMPYDKIDTLHIVHQQDPGKLTYSYGVACRLEFT